LLCSLIVFLFMFVGMAPTAMAAPLPASPSDPGRDVGAAAGPITLTAGAPLASPTATDIKNLNTDMTYATIADALADAATLDGHVLDVQVSPHAEGIVNVTKSITILGGGGGGAIITPAANTGGSGDARGWFLVSAPNVTFQNLTLDGAGYNIFQAIRCNSAGLAVDQCAFQNIKYSTYLGMAVVSYWDAVVTDCAFSNIERIGVILFGPGVTAGQVSGCTYTGKGPGNWIDYGIELGGGAVATLTGNSISGCTGVALSDGSGSAGVLITTYYGAGTTGTLSNNFLAGNSVGLYMGFDTADVSTVTAFDNDLSGNPDGAAANVSATNRMDASGNWWGSADPATVLGGLYGDIDYTPWLAAGTDVGGIPADGFQGDFSALWVDDDSPQVGAVGRIQEGVGLVSGSTINVAAGTYEEQVEVTQNVTIQGAGPTTVIKSPVTLALGFATSKPVVYVHDTAAMTLKDLTVDGAGRGNTNYKFIGVGFRNAGGTVDNCTVTGIRDTPFSGAQHGVGIYAYNDDGTPRAVTVQGCTVVDFQKNAMALNASDTTPMTVDVTGNVVTGAGPTAVTAQNGIQTWGDLITGTIDYNDVSGIAYSGTGWVATSILVYYADVLVDNNTVTGGHTCIYNVDGDSDITNNDLAVIKTGGYGYGIIATDPPAAKPSPFGEESVEAPRTGVLSLAGTAAVLVIDISGNSVIFGGPDNLYTVGIEADAGYGPDDLAVTANNNTVTGFDYGMGFWQCTSACDTGVFTSIAAHQNDLSGNTSFAFSTNATVIPDATCNWWGDANGPDAPPVYLNPAGGSLEGDATFSPWLVSPTGPCAGANEVVADVSALGCVHLTDPCVTVPVMFNRVDTTPLRAVSVTFVLSSELELCGAGVQPGTLFDTYGMLTPYFYLTDNTGGSYTVDYSILGDPCGPTTGGELFTIDVTASGTASPEDVGTITIVSVDARDCGNPFAAIPAMAGAPAEITIDNAVPAAIAGLAAAQLKAGNDADGTTVITLTWPAVEAGATVELFRKGFGAYPEYDDAGGAVPSTPADPAAALLAGWTSVGVQVSPYADETDAERDFYYYVAFVTDACGNVSAVSNRTNGTLNYHLGDVMPSATPPPFGDNDVELLDVSHLGAHYGVLSGNPLYTNILDIGPTTDSSTNGRPTTDNRIQFEDLIILAINYGMVSKPLPAQTGVERNAVALAVTPSGDGIEAVMTLSSTGAVQGVSIPLLWNAEAVEPIATRSGELTSRQMGRALVLSPEPGTVDAAVFGSTFSGEGELAVITFRVIGAGDPGIRFGEVIARDIENRPVTLETTVESRDLPVTPVVTRLLPSAPNPFLGSTQIRFALAEPGEAAVRVYALDGRLVRTLLDASLPAGEKSLTWDGRDEMGRSVAAGTYIVRFQAPRATDSQRVMRLR
jgi:hypothetical protein